MNTSTLTKVAAAGLAPRILRSLSVRWMFFGVAAYYGLKYLNKKGVMPKQTEAALGMIDHGIDLAKEKFGFQTSNVSAQANRSKKALTSASAIH